MGRLKAGGVGAGEAAGDHYTSASAQELGMGLVSESSLGLSVMLHVGIPRAPFTTHAPDSS